MWDLFQNLFLSPLIGAIMGLLLGWWLAPPPGQRTTIQFSYTNVVNSFNTTIYNYGQQYEDNQQTAAFAIGIVILFIYVKFGYLVFQVLTFFAALIVTVDLVFLILGLQQGKVGWIANFIWPLIPIAITSSLLLSAFEVYQALQANGPITLESFKYFSVRKDLFIFSQAVGTAGIGVTLYASSSIIAHYACLGSLTDPGDPNSTRWRMAARTRRFVSVGGYFSYLHIDRDNLGVHRRRYLRLATERHQWLMG
jgi:hypothetical protein